MARTALRLRQKKIGVGLLISARPTCVSVISRGYTIGFDSRPTTFFSRWLFLVKLSFFCLSIARLSLAWLFALGRVLT
jgi:hypothetical protein